MFNLSEPWRRTLLIMFVAQLMTAIGFSNIFPFLPLYVDFLGSRTALSVEFLAGAVFSAQALTMMIASPLWGAVADRYGRKLMVQRAMFGGSIILLLMGFVRTAEELVLLRALQGMVTGTVAAANALVASVAPRDQMGYAMGMLQMGLLAGIAIGPLIGGVMADTVGYQMTFVLTAVLLFASGLLVHFGVTEKFTPRIYKDDQKHTLWGDWQHVIMAPGVSVTYLLSFLSHLARVIIIPMAPLFIVTIMPADGRVNTMTGLIVGLAAGASTITAVYLGRLGDRWGHRRILRYSALAAALFYLPQAFVTDIWQLLLLQLLTGAAAGGMTPALGALLAGYTEPGEEGSAFGIDNSIVAASRAVAPLLGAAVATWFGLRSTFLLTGMVFLLVALVAIWYLPEKRPLGVESDKPCSSSA